MYCKGLYVTIARSTSNVQTLWQHSEGELRLFIDFLNSRMPIMNFKEEVSQTRVSLDVTVKLKIEIDLYC